MTAVYDRSVIKQLLDEALDSSLSNQRRGAALEDAADTLFSAIPGVEHLQRNGLDAHGCQEIDLAFWNGGAIDGLRGFDQIIHVESKNWSAAVGSLEVAWFDTKLRLRGRRLGVLISLSGITGNVHSLRSAEDVISNALREGREILVIDLIDLLGVGSPADLVVLLQMKRVKLSVTRGLSS